MELLIFIFIHQVYCPKQHFFITSNFYIVVVVGNVSNTFDKHSRYSSIMDDFNIHQYYFLICHKIDWVLRIIQIIPFPNPFITRSLPSYIQHCTQLLIKGETNYDISKSICEQVLGNEGKNLTNMMPTLQKKFYQSL